MRVPHGPGLHLLRGQEHALEGPDPGALLDPLCRADAVGRARHGAGAQAHLLGRSRSHSGSSGGSAAAAALLLPTSRHLEVQQPVHGALAVAVVRAHVATCRRHARRGGKGGEG